MTKKVATQLTSKDIFNLGRAHALFTMNDCDAAIHVALPTTDGENENLRPLYEDRLDKIPRFDAMSLNTLREIAQYADANVGDYDYKAITEVAQEHYGFLFAGAIEYWLGEHEVLIKPTCWYGMYIKFFDPHKEA